jgi:translation initiation factor IF-3
MGIFVYTIERVEYMRKFFKPDSKPVANQKDNINENIRARTIILITDEGENIGKCSIDEARKIAANKNLDVVQMNNEEIPTCKVMNYGKYLFEKSKKSKDAKKSFKHDEKEIRLRTSIAQNDLQIKAKKTNEFIKEGRKVLVSFVIKGRENRHPELIKEVMDRFISMVNIDNLKVENKGTRYTLSA